MTAVSKLPDKKKRLLDAGLALMLQKGYSSTAIDEICESAGVTKGSFFHYFKSKDDLTHALIDHFAGQRGGMIAERLAPSQADSAAARVYALVDAVADICEQPGCCSCLVGNLTQELCQEKPEIREHCCEALESQREAFARDLSLAVEERGATPDFDPETLADYFVALLQGSIIVAKARGGPSVVRANIKHFREELSRLVPPVP